jgi:hypothetical protein
VLGEPFVVVVDTEVPFLGAVTVAPVTEGVVEVAGIVRDADETVDSGDVVPELVAEPDAELDTELERTPLQAPLTQVLNAHMESEEQEAWKFPQEGIRLLLTA